jgi:hypothetical protein
VGDTFKAGRYTVLSKLGWGHFSTVWLCADATTGKEVALKARRAALRCGMVPAHTHARCARCGALRRRWCCTPRMR